MYRFMYGEIVLWKTFLMFHNLMYIENREDNRREVKKAKEGFPVSLWDIYSAFANCYGGVSILGVKEARDGTWRTTGLKDASKLRKDFFDTINNRKKVGINLITDDDVEIYTVGETMTLLW